MSTRNFLQQLRRQDVRIWLEGDRLRVNGPGSVLTPGLQAELTARKPEIVSFLETAAVKRSSIIPIQSSGSRPAFYGVPGHNGDVFCFVRLARQLGPDQPFYAFEPPGVDGGQPPVASIEAMAALYLADLRAVQPDGPYYLGGFCLGGIIAFELARRLVAQGQDVSLLALFESPSPKGLTPWQRTASGVRYRRDQLAIRLRELARVPWPERFAFVRRRLASSLRRTEASPTVGEASGWHGVQRDRVAEASLRAAYRYVLQPRTYPGRIVLFLGSEESKRRAYGRQLDWARVAAGGLEVHVGPDGCDGSVRMFREPHVRVFANLLRCCIDGRPRPMAE